MHAAYALLPGLTLDVDRSGGDEVVERYTWRNVGDERLTVTALAVNTPFRDLYASAAEALREAVHAHVWTGGADAWVLAEPMSGTGRRLGLVVGTGELWAYRAESPTRRPRPTSAATCCCTRPTTPATRRRSAGSPESGSRPGRSWCWSGGSATDDRAAFLAATRPGPVADRLVAQTGQPIAFTGPVDGLMADPGAVVTRGPDGATTVATRTHGVVHVGTLHHRTAVLFTEPLPDLVRRRVRFLLDHQRPTERPSPDDAAFVPYDGATGLTQPANAWPDWSDGAERLAMPTLLQQARAAAGWTTPSRAERSTGSRRSRGRGCSTTPPRRRGADSDTPVRIYNSPWLAHFFVDEYAGPAILPRSTWPRGSWSASFAFGAGQHLSIGHPRQWSTSPGG